MIIRTRKSGGHFFFFELRNNLFLKNAYGLGGGGKDGSRHKDTNIVRV